MVALIRAVAEMEEEEEDEMVQKDESAIMQEPSFTAADGSFEANFEFGQEQEPIVFEDEPLIDFNDESIIHAKGEPIVQEKEVAAQVEKVVEEEVDDDGFTTSTLNTITILKNGFSKSGELSFGELKPR
jgi:hypothetical protein